MYAQRSDPKKLVEIQILALECHRDLIDRAEARDLEQQGGFLIQGNNYARSRKMFLGLNPRSPEEGEFRANLIEENGPWETHPDTSESVHPELRYWNNCACFFGSDDFLKRWIIDATSTFIVPWVTNSEKDLFCHPLWREGTLKDYSHRIFLKMVQHCEPEIIIAVGKSSRELIAEFLGLRSSFEYEVSPEEGWSKFGNAACQWGKQGGKPTVYQIPHLSRMGKATLQYCAAWLSGEIQRNSPAGHRPTS